MVFRSVASPYHGCRSPKSLVAEVKTSLKQLLKKDTATLRLSSPHKAVVSLALPSLPSPLLQTNAFLRVNGAELVKRKQTEHEPKSSTMLNEE